LHPSEKTAKTFKFLWEYEAHGEVSNIGTEFSKIGVSWT